MQITIEDKAIVSIGKTGKALDVNFAEFAPHVLQYIVSYGIKQVLNDAGSAAKTDAEKVAMAEKNLDTLLRGEIRAARESDPVAARAKKIAIAVITKAMKAKGLDPAAKDSNFSTLVMEYAGKPAVREMAKAQLEAEADIDIDL